MAKAHTEQRWSDLIPEAYRDHNPLTLEELLPMIVEEKLDGLLLSVALRAFAEGLKVDVLQSYIRSFQAKDTCLEGYEGGAIEYPVFQGFYWAKPPDGPVRVVAIDKYAGEGALCMTNPGTDCVIDLPVEGWLFYGPLKIHEFPEPEEEDDDQT